MTEDAPVTDTTAGTDPALETNDAPDAEAGPDDKDSPETQRVTLARNGKQILEALLFAADQPVPVARLSQVMGKRMDARALRELIKELNEGYRSEGHAFEIVEAGGGFQLFTRPEYRRWVMELHKHRRQDKLTPSAIETLAIIAYKQPVLRVKIEDIRGVQAGPILRNLMERGLIKVVGFQNVPGRPRLYGTTRIFLDHFQLRSLKDLPKVEELALP